MRTACRLGAWNSVFQSSENSAICGIWATDAEAAAESCDLFCPRETAPPTNSVLTYMCLSGAGSGMPGPETLAASQRGEVALDAVLGAGSAAQSVGGDSSPQDELLSRQIARYNADRTQ